MAPLCRPPAVCLSACLVLACTIAHPKGTFGDDPGGSAPDFSQRGRRLWYRFADAGRCAAQVSGDGVLLAKDGAKRVAVSAALAYNREARPERGGVTELTFALTDLSLKNAFGERERALALTAEGLLATDDPEAPKVPLRGAALLVRLDRRGALVSKTQKRGMKVGGREARVDLTPLILLGMPVLPSEPVAAGAIWTGSRQLALPYASLPEEAVPLTYQLKELAEGAWGGVAVITFSGTASVLGEELGRDVLYTVQGRARVDLDRGAWLDSQLTIGVATRLDQTIEDLGLALSAEMRCE
jgi:hypothetical protein